MTNENRYYVYALFRPWNGLPFYIGKGKGQRHKRHHAQGATHANRHIASIFRKAARLGLEVPLVMIRTNLSEAAAFDAERALIAAIGRGPGAWLANLTDGGEGTSGRKLSAEARGKLRQAMLGNKRSLGVKHSEEWKARARLRVVSESAKEKLRLAHTGKTLTAEHRAKLSIAHQGKTLSPEHIANMTAAHKGLKRSAKTIERMRAAQQNNSAMMSQIIRVRWTDPDYRQRASKAISVARLKSEEKKRQHLSGQLRLRLNTEDQEQ